MLTVDMCKAFFICQVKFDKDTLSVINDGTDFGNNGLAFDLALKS